ncbi:hypothetical protein ACFX2I_023403 [Malus domestica]
MMKKAVQVYIISVLKPCQNLINRGSMSQQLTRMAPPTPPPPPPPTTPFVVGPPKVDPCVRLFFRDLGSPKDVLQLLPSAWSHNPLTTLKIICNLQEAQSDDEAFLTAMVWLHQNHPNTLAHNLLPITVYFSCIIDLVPLLTRVLLDGRRHEVDHKEKYNSKCRISQRNVKLLRRHQGAVAAALAKKMAAKLEAKEKASKLLTIKKSAALATKAAERYESDPHFRLLHDLVSDIFADCLKHDIGVLQHHHSLDENDDAYYSMEITCAAKYCPTVHSAVARPTDLLFESIANKVFPSDSNLPPNKQEEGGGRVEAQERLSKEVLAPLRNVLATPDAVSNRWGYSPHPFMVEKYEDDVVDVNASGGYMLPHDIISYFVYHDYKGNVEAEAEAKAEAEREWKRMVEDLSIKQGALNKCLAVCDAPKNMIMNAARVSLALGILTSELNQEPAWKGKVMFYSQKPELHLIQGDDLESKCAFMRGMEHCQEWMIDLRKVFDVILEAAVKENLKPEQMVKNVLVVTHYKHFTGLWKRGYYEEIVGKYKEKGYGGVVPHLVFWNIINPEDNQPGNHIASGLEGVTLVTDFTDRMLKLLLDNDAQMGPEHVMEAALSGHKYQTTLAVVD